MLDEAGARPRRVPEQDGLGGAVDQRAEEVQVERLLDEVEDALLEGGAGGGDVAVGGDHDGLGVGLEVAGGAEDLRPASAPSGATSPCGGLGPRGVWHAQVGDDDVEGAVAELVEGAGDVVDDRADVAGLLEGVGHDVGVVGLVLDDQDLGPRRLGRVHSHATSVKEKVHRRGAENAEDERRRKGTGDVRRPQGLLRP